MGRAVEERLRDGARVEALVQNDLGPGEPAAEGDGQAAHVEERQRADEARRPIDLEHLVGRPCAGKMVVERQPRRLGRAGGARGEQDRRRLARRRNRFDRRKLRGALRRREPRVLQDDLCPVIQGLENITQKLRGVRFAKDRAAGRHSPSPGVSGMRTIPPLGASRSGQRSPDKSRPVASPAAG